MPLPDVVAMQTRHPNLEGARDPAAPAGRGGAADAALPHRGRRGAPGGECLDLSQNALDVRRLALGRCPGGTPRADQGLGCTA